MLPLNVELSVLQGLPVFPQNWNILGAVSRKILKNMYCILLFDLFNQLNVCKKKQKKGKKR